MQRKSGKIVIELTSTGGERLRKELVSLGPAGEKALRRLDRATKSTRPGFRFLDGSVREVKSGLAGLASEAGPLGSVLEGLGGKGAIAAGAIGGIALALGGALKIAREATAAYSEMGRAADDLAVSTDAFQALKSRAELAGIEVAELQGNIRAFTNASAEAATGQGTLVEKLKLANPELLNQIMLAGSMDEKLNIVAVALSKARTEQEKTQIVQAAFGESGRSMIRVFDDMDGGLNGLIGTMSAAGYVIDEEMIRTSIEMETRMREASLTIDTQLKKSFVELMPVLVTGAELFAKVTKAAADLLGTLNTTQGPDGFDIIQTVGEAGTELLEKDLAGFEKRRDEALKKFNDASSRGLGVVTKKHKAELDKLNEYISVTEEKIAEVQSRLASNPVEKSVTISDKPSPARSQSGPTELEKILARQKAAADAAREQAAAQRELSRIIDQAKTPQENYNSALENLGRLRGQLTDTQYAVELDRITAIRDKAIASQEEDNRLKAQAADLQKTLAGITAQIIDPQERYNAALQRLRELKPHLSVDEYTTALKAEKDALDASNQALRERELQQSRIAGIRQGLMTDQERMAAEIKSLDADRAANGVQGGLTDAEYAAQVDKIRESYEKLNSSTQDHIDLQGVVSQALKGQIKSWNDVGQVALDILAQIILKALDASNIIGGSGGGIAGAIGSGISSALGFGNAASSASAAGTAAVTSKVAAAGGAGSKIGAASPGLAKSMAGSAAGAPIYFSVIDQAGVAKSTEEREGPNGERKIMITLTKLAEKAALQTIQSPEGKKAMKQTYGIRPKLGAA